MKSRQMTDEELANIKQLNINLLILDKVVSESTWENVSEWIMCGGYAMMEKACCQNMIHKMPDDNGLVDWARVGFLFMMHLSGMASCFLNLSEICLERMASMH